MWGGAKRAKNTKNKLKKAIKDLSEKKATGYDIIPSRTDLGTSARMSKREGSVDIVLEGKNIEQVKSLNT